MTLPDALVALLTRVIFPLWLLAGAVDWLCHRRSAIDATSGERESRLHLLMFAQVATPVVAALFLRINALLLVIFGAAAVAHLATSAIDTSYTDPRRRITPLEQHVHAFLDLLPLFAVALVFVLHGDAWRDPEWRFVARDTPLPTGPVAATLLAFGVTLALILEEWWRCRRHANTRDGTGGVRVAP